MRLTRLYLPQNLNSGSTIELDDSAAHYVKNVLRIKVGRPLLLFNGQPNGQGRYGEYQAEVVALSKKAVTVEVGEFSALDTESPLVIELGVCVIKNDPMDWLIQKAVELGVSSIKPLNSEYCDIKLSPERLQKKQQHWQQVAIHAAEQCGRARVPEVAELQDLAIWSANANADQKYILHPYHSQALASIKSDQAHTIALAVGPEGGFSEQEVAQSLGHGFQALFLGPRILRAETAPLTALALLQSQFGDWR